MSPRRYSALLSVLLSLTAASGFVEELDDNFMDIKEPDDIWLIKFYAPWCTFCKQLDPVWHDVASELKSLGSLVNVGKADATAHSGLAKEFKVRGYPAILMLKNDVKYNYMGPRTKDGFLDFADRVAGPLVRALTSPQLFQHAMSRHDVLFLYIGASSTLKGEYMSAAEELIVHTYFFSATRDVLPKAVSLPPLPAVAVFKDGTLFTYNKERDGELKAWINRERFLTYFKIDSYTLYAMGETGKLVALALVDETRPSEKGVWYKTLLEKVALEHRDVYSRDFHFGYMEGNAYVNGLVMGEVTMPALIVLNLSNDGYFLPLGVVETERHLLDFLDGVLNSSVQCQGGNSVLQRFRRFVFEVRNTLQPLFEQAPLVACFVVSFPLAIVSLLCFVCWKARLPVEEEEERSSAPKRRKQD
ncbi:protein disulfide-isomerase TMX3-like isoform X2 [Myripristis murdjan]|uniref:protein disulfide-isomerase TMX3-like isoform X2 n=1 Tax=Myripristis murdjan TaxID=586833 RepID=UPI0011761D4B|nr:protein disulfide-isomerase TMX3-like isoform X2 [Myripristis murdjan]